MKYSGALWSFCFALAGSLALVAASAQGAEVKADVAVQEGGKVTHTTTATLVDGKAVEIQAGPYKLVVTLSLLPENMVRLEYTVNGSGLPFGGAVRAKPDRPFKLINGHRVIAR